jgi:serine/threonine protein kinase
MKSGVYSERRAAKLMKQVLSCVNYFHSKGVVHRDLKPGSK